MATENEKLQLDVEVNFNDDDALDRLESGLESVDREIAETGSGREKVDIDIDIDGVTQAVTEVQSLNAALESLDDKTVNVDVDKDAINAGGVNAGDGIATSGGRRDLSHLDAQAIAREEGVAGVMNEAVADAVRNRNDLTPQLVETAFEDAGIELDDDVLEELTTATTANPPTHFDAPFGQGTGNADERRVGNLFEIFDAAEEANDILRNDIERREKELDTDIEFDQDSFNQVFADILDNSDFRVENIGEIDPDDTLQPFNDPNRGLAAEGIQGVSSVDLLQAQRAQPEFDDRQQGGFLKQLRRQTDDIAKEFVDFEFTIESFHKIFAAMVPLVVAFVGALPAAISAVAGLATAALTAAGGLAVLGGLALGGMMLTPSGQLSTEPLMERLRGLFDTFLTEFEPVMRQFEGLAIGAFDQFEQMLGPLAQASTTLTVLEDEFNAVLSTITGGLPRAVQTMAAFAEATAPVLGMVLGQLMSADVLTFFIQQLSRLEPVIFVLIGSLKELIPAIVIVSEGFLLTVTVLSSFAAILSTVINRFPILGQLLGFAASLVLILASATTIASLATMAYNTALIQEIATLYAAAKAHLIANSAVAKWIAGQIAAAKAAIASALGISATTAAVVALIGALTLGVGALAAASSGFLDLRDSIGLANAELEKFNELTPGDVDTGGQLGVNGRSPRGGGNSYTTVIDANGQDAAARQQYSESYERQHVDSVFGG